ncbi:hypothetical protein D5S17_15270 [Pseudonocardiaceae bacterium YIM PH 21723]|nr:hypothetical protein D5S17_15270 [Pseudonocardiaceae bacterium YIM PH 21723]
MSTLTLILVIVAVLAFFIGVVLPPIAARRARNSRLTQSGLARFTQAILLWGGAVMTAAGIGWLLSGFDHPPALVGFVALVTGILLLSCLVLPPALPGLVYLVFSNVGVEKSAALIQWTDGYRYWLGAGGLVLILILAVAIRRKGPAQPAPPPPTRYDPRNLPEI